jgi:hypothetical protein
MSSSARHRVPRRRPQEPRAADINAQLSRRLLAARPSKAFSNAAEDVLDKVFVSPSRGFEGHLQNERDSGVFSTFLAENDRLEGATGCLQPVVDRARVEDNPWHPELVGGTTPTRFLTRRGEASVVTIARSPAIVRRFLASRTIPLSRGAAGRMIYEGPMMKAL